MCGIAGALSPPEAPALDSLVDEIVKDQLRRGPDHQASDTAAGKSCRATNCHAGLFSPKPFRATRPEKY